MGISEDANAAADYIESHGHTKRSFTDNGRACIVGAIFQGNSDAVEDWYCDNHYGIITHPTVAAVSDYLGGTDSGTVFDWNDDIERKPEEVIQVLRDVAIKHAPDEMRSK